MYEYMLKISFEANTANANILVDEAKTSVERSTLRAGMKDMVRFEREKDRTETQDMGSILVLLMGAPALVAVAKGIQDFIAKSQDKVIIMTQDGTVIATGSSANNIDVAATVASLRQAKSK